MKIQAKRVYEPARKTDGTRVLVDRVWPRGVSKERAGVDRWLKEVAPSKELRQWFGHDPTKWQEFQQRYAAELDDNPEAVEELESLAREGVLTLVYAAKDEHHNNAVALKQYLEGEFE